MDRRDPSYVPAGWTKAQRNSRVIFKRSPPGVIIQNKGMLKDYQSKGRFPDTDADRLDFRLLSVKTVKDSDGKEDDGDQKEVEDEQMEVVDEYEQLEVICDPM